MLRRGESISESSQGGCDEEDNTESVPTPAMSSSSNSNRKEKDGSDSTTIGKKETRAVVRSKLLVYGVLIMAATAVTVYWYTFLKKAEQSSFEEQVRTGQYLFCEPSCVSYIPLSLYFSSRAISSRSRSHAVLSHSPNPWLSMAL